MGNIKYDSNHCSYDQDQSWTDPVSNMSSIASVGFYDDILGWIKTGRLRNSLFNPYVHEFIHHWCFNTPLGFALACLQLRARRAAFQLTSFKNLQKPRQDIVEQLFDDVYKYEAALSSLRPLAEGLALFGEFDLSVGDSLIQSHIMAWVSTSFVDFSFLKTEIKFPQWIAKILYSYKYSPLSHIWQKRFRQKVNGFMFSHRVSDNSIRLKQSLLASTFDCNSGGYLPGYMLIKKIWNCLVFEKKCTKLFDKDLFLMYFRSFIYEDTRFVEMILGEHINHLNIGNYIQAFIHLRINKLFSSSNNDLVKFEQDVLLYKDKLPVLPPTDIDLLGFRSVLNSEYFKSPNLSQMIRELSLEDDITKPEEFLKFNDQTLLYRRNIMCVASYAVNVIVNDSGQAEVFLPDASGHNKSAKIISATTFDGVEPQNSHGSVEFYIDPYNHHRFALIYIESSPVSLYQISQDIPIDLVSEYKRKRSGLYLYTQHQKSSTEDIYNILSDEGYQTKLADFRASLKGNLNHFYPINSLYFSDPADAQSMASAMSKSALYDICKGDIKLLESITLLSLIVSIKNDYDYVKRTFDINGLSLTYILSECDKLTSSYKIPLFVTMNGFILSYI